MLMRPLVRSRTLLAQISPPLPQGKAVPSTSDMRYSLLYLAGVCATAGADERARAAAAARPLARKVRSFIAKVSLLNFWEISSPGVLGAREPAAGRRSLRSSPDRKSTRLNSSHSQISYAVFCLK